MGVIEAYIAVALLFGGTIGWGLSQSDDSKTISTEIEPANWDPRIHRKLLRECALQCRKSGAKFRSYEPMSGDCRCYGTKRRDR